MENKEFFDNNGIESMDNNIQTSDEYQRTVYPQYTQQQSSEYQTESYQEAPQQYDEVFSNSQDTAPIHPLYQDVYSDGYNSNTEPVKKAKKSGRKAAVIAGTLALALCVGFGGGVLGSYVAGNSNAKTIVQNGASVNAKTTQGTDSSLNIIQAAKSDNAPTNVEEVVTKVKDSVVEITTEVTKYGTFYGQYVAQGAGSGVIISQDGYIVTNNHVIEDATSIKVTLTDGNVYDAKLVGTDEELDVALIKIEATNLTVAALGSSSDLNLGETAIVIGNPLGQLGGTVTHGIISALNRSIQLDGKNMELLQTDAAINPGNSGGGLFDEDGNLIGIIVAKSTSSSDGTSLEGLGFAIPIDNVKKILGDLKTKGYVGRAVLGITAVDVFDDTTAAKYNVTKQGVYVYSITSGGAAEKAGLMVGDCILKIDGVELTSKEVLSSEISKHSAGDKVTLTIYRDGKEQDIQAVLTESTNQSSQKSSNNFNKNGGNSDNNGGYYSQYPDNIEDWFRMFN